MATVEEGVARPDIVAHATPPILPRQGGGALPVVGCAIENNALSEELASPGDDSPSSNQELTSEEELAGLSDEELEQRFFDWHKWALPKQLPPPGDWTTWLLMGGRGSGKTRAGAEWVRVLAKEKVTPIALVGETMTEALSIMVRGESGIIAVHPDDDRPILRGGNRLVWPNGVEAWIMTALDPERFRGPQFAAAWCDELGCAAVDKGANQPNIFGDAKSAEGGRPYFSNGLSDPLIQRQFLRAHYRHWGNSAKNPAGMVDLERIYCWTWDARPYPAFPARTDVWADGVNHAAGHWLTGRLGAMSNDELASAMAAEHGAVLHAGASEPMVSGVILGAPGTARDALEPIMAITGQRLVARSGVLTAISARDGATVAIEREELAQGEGAVFSQRRAAAVERPGRLALSHIDKGRDYLTASAMAVRPGAGQLVSESVSMVLDGAAARLAAERLLDDRAASVDTVELALPPNLVALEPGDRIAVDGEGPFEITEIRDGATRRVTARSLSAGLAAATGVDRAPAAAPIVGVAVAPVVFAAHLPPFTNDPTRSRLVFGAYAKPWPGAVRLVDTAVGGTVLDLTRPAVLGEVVEGIGPGPVTVWDRGSDLTIRLYGGHIADGPEGAVLGGSNRLAVETDAGVWEVIGFAGAELVETGLYRLTRLLRGLDGTDWAMGPVSGGRRVMVLDGRVGGVPVEAGRLGEERTIRAYAGTADLTGQVITAATATAPGLPLAPVHLRAQRVGTGDIAFSWVRRSRAEDDAWGIAEPALEVVPEHYRLSIFDGATLKRSIEVSAASASYGAAEQSADFGGPATSFGFLVAQVSAALGAGHAAEGNYGE